MISLLGATAYANLTVTANNSCTAFEAALRYAAAMTSASAHVTLWDRTREMASHEILQTALRLFTAQGFDETTVAQVAREAGVSERTLFRYFGTKEDLVGGSQEQFVSLMKDAAREQPIEANEWEVLRAAFEVALSLNPTTELALERFRLVYQTDSLRTAYLGKRMRCQEELLPILQARPATQETDHGKVRAIVATAFACFDAATVTWLESNGQDNVLDLYDQALAGVRS
jgi:AcrR family transcriptional regulator